MKRATAQFEQDYYGRYYPDYDRQNPPHKMRFYRLLTEQVVADTPRPRLLDVGCAFGKFLSSANPAWERFGTDISQFAIEQARSSCPDISFAVSTATDLPFDGAFDVITAFDVIEHVPSLEQVASAVRSRLLPQAHFIYVVPVYDGPTGPLIRLLDKDPTHIHKCSRDFWLKWTESNFRLIDWWGIFRYLLPWGFYWHTPTKKLRRYTPAIAVIAQNQ
jgi:SAM-dependent methyltransferase